MKKIAILTLVLDNYGTKLQSFALSKTIKRLVGIEPEVVDLQIKWGDGQGVLQKFWNPFRNVYATYGCSFLRRYIDIVIWRLETIFIKLGDRASEQGLMKSRHDLFENMSLLIPYSKTSYTADDLRNGLLPEYDYYVVGSDQVWNGIKVGNQDVFMLDFLNDKKGLTYAASFGMTEIPLDMIDVYKKGIRNFSSLLIREKEGVDLCEQLGRMDAVQVLDPTLLLDEKEYDEVIDCDNLVDDDYILVYSLNSSLKIYRESKKLAANNNCKLVALKTKRTPPIDNHIEELCAVSPGGFIWLIKHAKCIVTSSYHAFLFSIILKRPVFLFLDNADVENCRMINIVDMLDMKQCVCWETGGLPLEIINLDYNSIYNHLQEEREKSLSCLRDAFAYIDDQT